MIYCNTLVSLVFLHAGARFGRSSHFIQEPSPRIEVREATKSRSKNPAMDTVVINGALAISMLVQQLESASSAVK